MSDRRGINSDLLAVKRLFLAGRSEEARIEFATIELRSLDAAMAARPAHRVDARSTAQDLPMGKGTARPFRSRLGSVRKAPIPLAPEVQGHRFKPQYDLIVCGSGSYGSVVTRRLAENQRSAGQRRAVGGAVRPAEPGGLGRTPHRQSSPLSPSYRACG